GHPEALGQPALEIEGGAVGIAVQVAERGRDRGDGLRRGAERVLVRGELDRVADAELALELLDRLAGRVRGERPDPLRHEGAHVHQASGGAAGYEPRTLSRVAPCSTSAS